MHTADSKGVRQCQSLCRGLVPLCSRLSDPEQPALQAPEDLTEHATSRSRSPAEVLQDLSKI